MARRAKIEGHLTRLNDVRYLGSHPQIGGVHDDLTIAFYPERIGIHDRRNTEQVTIARHRLSDLRALDRDEIETQVTAARVLLMGALAWVAKKSTKFSFLEISDPEGQWLFAVPHLSSIELRSGLDPIRRRYGVAAEVATTSTDPVTRLHRLDELRSNGILSDVEYQAQRARIISEL